MNSEKNKAILAVIFALITAMLSFDIYVPSMPDMTNFFKTTQEMMQFSLSASVIGSCICTFVLGGISDSIGRRKLIVFSTLGCVLSACMSAFAQNIEIFILSRLLQGVFYTAPTLLCFSVVADLFEPKVAAIYYAYLTTALTATLIVAPAIGGLLAHYWQWQMIFFFLAISGLIAFLLLYFYLPETLQKRVPFSIKHNLSVYRKIMASQDFFSLSIVPSMMVGGLIAFIANANYHFINQLGMTVGTFAIYQSIIMGANALFSYLAAYMIINKGVMMTAKTSVLLCTIGGYLLFAASFVFSENYVLLSMIVCTYAAGLGLGFAAFTAISMEYNLENAGSVSSILAMIRNLVVMLCVTFAGIIYNDKMWHIGVFMLINVSLMLLIFSRCSKWSV